MSENDTKHRRSLIESAMDRVAHAAPGGAAMDRVAHATPGGAAMDRVAHAAPGGASGTVSREPQLGRRDYDQALLHRDAQPETASHDEDQAAHARLSAENPPVVDKRARTYGPGTLLLTGVVSALGAAGLTWLAIGGADRGGVVAPMPPAAVVPSAAPAATVESPPAVVPLPAPAVLPADIGEPQARDLLERWRQAWSSRDVEAYLDCYSPDFLPADGQARTAWAAARRKKLSSQSDISVQVHDVRLERIDGDQMKAMFLQDYASGTYREDARPKTLLLVKAGGDWRIAGEWQGTPPASATSKS